MSQMDRRNYDVLRREEDREKTLNRDDIFLLLEGYRNTIELNTILLERQETLNSAIDRINAEITNICKNQAGIKAQLTDICKDIQNPLHDHINQAITRYKTLQDTIDKNRQEVNREHSGQTVKLYSIIGIMATIIIGLIGLVLKIM